MEIYYNLHDFLRIRITQNNLDLKTNYEHYFSQIKSDHAFNEVNYHIKEYSEFKPPENYFNVSDLYLGFEGGVCFPKENYALTYDGNKITEYTTYANRATNLYIQALLVQNNMSLVHCAGIELNGKGLIFPAFGGAGKTMLVSEMRKLTGFKLFGDDFVIIDGNSNMYSYPSDLSVYDHHIELFPELKNTIYHNYLLKIKKYNQLKKLVPGERYIRMILNLGNSIFTKLGIIKSSSKWNLDYIKVPINIVFPADKIGTKTKLSASIFLSRYNGDGLKIEKMNLEKLVQEVNGILNVEFRYGLIYLQMLSAFGGFDLSKFELNQKQNIEKCFSNMALYRVKIPYNVKPEKYCEFMLKFVEELTI